MRRLRDWASDQLLARLGVSIPPSPYPVIPGEPREPGWVGWGATLAAVSPLACPRLASPLHTQVRRRRLDIARGVTRAVLRGDTLTAARLTRWLACSSGDLLDPPFPPEPVLAHLHALGAGPRGGGSAMLELEIAMARRSVTTGEHTAGDRTGG